MAGLWSFTQSPRLCFITCFSAVFFLLLLSQASRPRQQEERLKRHVPDSTEIPSEHIDPAAIDLTPLVNALINSTHSGSRQLFSLLSVTSYSSLALHKLTLLVYNISGVRSIEADMFRRRFCYCVTNETNDLTDFTAILLDVMGNSTSYLQELFKSSSILSVSQKNNSNCIYICVMAGKTGREVSDLWEAGSITPLFNQTIVEGPHAVVNVSSFRLPAEWQQLPTNLSHVSPSGMSSMLTSRVHSTAHASPTSLDERADATTAQPLTTPPHSTTVVPQSPETSGAWRTQRFTTVSRTTQALTQPATLPSVTTSQSESAEKATILSPIRTSKQPASTVSETTKPPAPDITTTELTRLTSDLKATTFSITPTKTTTTASTTKHTSFTVLTGPSPVRATVEPAAASRTTPDRTTTRTETVEPEKPGCPWRRPELAGGSVSGGMTPISAHKLQPCVLELCKFFSQCLCRPFDQKTRMKRYCDDSQLWYEEHTAEVCRRVRRVSLSRNLKQRCLTKMCSKL